MMLYSDDVALQTKLQLQKILKNVRASIWHVYKDTWSDYFSLKACY